MEALPYANMEQTTYPHPVELIVYNLSYTAREMSEALKQAPFLTSCITSRQQSTLVALSEAVRHLAASLLRNYVDEGIPVHIGPAWTQRALEQAITKGPHASACAPKMTAFIRGEIRQHVQNLFIILLPVTDAVRLFGDKLKLSGIVAVPQKHRRPRLIFNLLAQPDEGAPSVNDTTYREVTLDWVQFWPAFPRILQAIWEAGLDKGTVRVSNLDVTDVYPCGTLQPSRVVSFTYLVPPTTNSDCIIICIDRVLSVVWVDSPKFFCAFS